MSDDVVSDKKRKDSADVENAKRACCRALTLKPSGLFGKLWLGEKRAVIRRLIYTHDDGKYRLECPDGGDVLLEEFETLRTMSRCEITIKYPTQSYRHEMIEDTVRGIFETMELVFESSSQSPVVCTVRTDFRLALRAAIFSIVSVYKTGIAGEPDESNMFMRPFVVREQSIQPFPYLSQALGVDERAPFVEMADRPDRDEAKIVELDATHGARGGAYYDDAIAYCLSLSRHGSHAPHVPRVLAIFHDRDSRQLRLQFSLPRPITTFFKLDAILYDEVRYAMTGRKREAGAGTNRFTPFFFWSQEKLLVEPVDGEYLRASTATCLLSLSGTDFGNLLYQRGREALSFSPASRLKHNWRTTRSHALFNNTRQMAEIATGYISRLAPDAQEANPFFMLSPDSVFIDISGKLWHIPLPGGIAFHPDYVPTRLADKPEHAIRWCLARFVFFYHFHILLDDWCGESDLTERVPAFPETASNGAITSPLLCEWLVLCATNTLPHAELLTHPFFTLGDGEMPPSFFGPVPKMSFNVVQLERFRQSLALVRGVQAIAETRKIVVPRQPEAELTGSNGYWHALSRVGEKKWPGTIGHEYELQLAFKDEDGFGLAVTQEIIFLAFEELGRHQNFVYDSETDTLSMAVEGSRVSCCGGQCPFVKKPMAVARIMYLMLSWCVHAEVFLPMRLSSEFLLPFLHNAPSASPAMLLAADAARRPHVTGGLLNAVTKPEQMRDITGGEDNVLDALAERFLVEPFESKFAKDYRSIVTVMRTTSLTGMLLTASIYDIDALSYRFSARSLCALDAATVPITRAIAIAGLNFKPEMIPDSPLLSASASGKYIECNETALELMRLSYPDLFVVTDRNGSRAFEDMLKKVHHIEKIFKEEEEESHESIIFFTFVRLRRVIAMNESIALFLQWLRQADESHLGKMWKYLKGSAHVCRASHNVLRTNPRSLDGVEFDDDAYRFGRLVVFSSSWENINAVIYPASGNAIDTSNHGYKVEVVMTTESDHAPPVFHVGTLPTFHSCISTIRLGVGYQSYGEFAEKMELSLAHAGEYTLL